MSASQWCSKNHGQGHPPARLLHSYSWIFCPLRLLRCYCDIILGTLVMTASPSLLMQVLHPFHIANNAFNYPFLEYCAFVCLVLFELWALQGREFAFIYVGRVQCKFTALHKYFLITGAITRIMYLLYCNKVFSGFKIQTGTTQSQQQDQKVSRTFNCEAEAVKSLCETLVN